MRKIALTTPLLKDVRQELCAGDLVTLSGTIYTARDAAHFKLAEVISNQGKLPFNIKDAIIYYVGPTPARPGQVIGSAGPTTAARMDRFTPQLLRLGLAATIGKGRRSPEVMEAIRETKSVYFGAVGGAGAVLSRSIISSEKIAYCELGTEAIRKLEVRDMPLIVLIDSRKNSLYESGPKAWRARRQKGLE